LIQIVTAWEQSGCGFGQQTLDNPEFGQATDEMMESGDDRANFIRPSLGHRSHHLLLWELSNEVGCLHSILNVLDASVSLDGDSVPTETVRVQKRRKHSILEEKERVEKRAFRLAVGESLASLAIASKEQKRTNWNATSSI
jgi:hypothetical protein